MIFLHLNTAVVGAAWIAGSAALNVAGADRVNAHIFGIASCALIATISAAVIERLEVIRVRVGRLK